MTTVCPAATPWCIDHAVDLGGVCIGEMMRYPGGIAFWLQKPPRECAEMVVDFGNYTKTFQLDTKA